MTVLRWLLGLLVVAVLGIVGYAATLPDRFRIERTVEIAAPPPAIFPLIEDLMQWPRWSPWEKRDPAMKRTFGNPNRGAGRDLLLVRELVGRRRPDEDHERAGADRRLHRPAVHRAVPGARNRSSSGSSPSRPGRG